MREVDEFVVVFPGRFGFGQSGGRDELIRALERDYPHYTFNSMAGHPLADEFDVIPVVGKIGGGEGDDPDEVYLCKPLDPRVIPNLLAKLRHYELLGAAVN